MTYIEEKSPAGNSDQVLVLSKSGDGGPSIYTGYRMTDWDDDKLMRKGNKGGLIPAVTKGRQDYANKTHFIFPVKSLDGTRARFLYKASLGHTILRNIKNTKK